jgi:hypothetical protein
MRGRLFITLSVLAALALAAIAWAERSAILIWLAPAKIAAQNQSEPAKHANARFWDALHAGRYEDLPGVIEELTAAYLQDPRDPETTAHIGFAHAWFGAERARLEKKPATLTEHVLIARRYFAEAVRLSPTDERFKGFLASMELGEGIIHGDEKLLRRGYFNLIASVNGWPEFNLFTAGYVLGRVPHTDPRFAEALEYLWRNIDVCIGEKIDRRAPDGAKYMALETRTGPKRACWNSRIAPHNFEGFFLNMGDMLVKQGDPATARRIYANARLSKTYDQWPFKPVLEERIVQADQNVALFRDPNPGERVRTPMVASAFACTACHQGN